MTPENIDSLATKLVNAGAVQVAGAPITGIPKAHYIQTDITEIK